MTDLLAAAGVTILLAIPLTLSVLALLDAARRPAWAWALAGRAQIVWLAAILFGTIAVPLGLVVSSVYLLRIRPRLAAAEDGRIDL